MNNLFHPAKGATVSIAVSSSTQPLKITRQDGRCDVRVYNSGTATVWIDFGDSTVTTSAATGMPIPAGAVCGFNTPKPYNDGLYVAVIAAGATGTVYFTPGVGI